MTVPNMILHEADIPQTTVKFKDTLARIMKPEDKIKVKEFMLENFYSDAIVPSAIKLRETWPII